MSFSDALRYQVCRDRLRRRRDVVLRTVAYLDCERNLLDAKNQNAGRSVLRQRKQLLDEIHVRYVAEANKIAVVLDRLKRSSSSANPRRSRNVLECS